MAARQVQVVVVVVQWHNLLFEYTMHNSAIIIFIKNPEKGKVKTRLAKTVGDDKALAIYKKLLQHTRAVTEDLKSDKYLYYSNKIDSTDEWSPEVYTKCLQDGNDLGQRMLNAFEYVFNKGHQKALIIGSDCQQLTTEMLHNAINQLHINDVVIGPTYDGGYYLLGMNKLHPDIFLNKNWSTETVYQDTINDVARMRHSVSVLPKLSDVDEEKDIPKDWQ